jgi:hypothetical protein
LVPNLFTTNAHLSSATSQCHQPIAVLVGQGYGTTTEEAMVEG